MNCKKEIKSLISNKEILSKVDFGSIEPIRNKDGFFYFIYKTTCLIDGRVYVGVRSHKNPNKDKYIGCGIKSNWKIRKVKCGKSHFKRSVIKYGYKNFIREILIYFKNRKQALLAEEIIVDDNFIKDERNLNVCKGGGAPPRGIGVNNPNYGKKWTKEQRERASKFFTNKTKGSKNPNAKKIFAVEIFTNPLIIHKFDTINDCRNSLQIKYVDKYASKVGHIYNGEYILVRESDYLSKKLEQWMSIWFENFSINYYRMLFEVAHFYNYKLNDKIVQDFANKYEIKYRKSLKERLYDFCEKHKKRN